MFDDNGHALKQGKNLAFYHFRVACLGLLIVAYLSACAPGTDLSYGYGGLDTGFYGENDFGFDYDNPYWNGDYGGYGGYWGGYHRGFYGHGFHGSGFHGGGAHGGGFHGGGFHGGGAHGGGFHGGGHR